MVKCRDCFHQIMLSLQRWITGAIFSVVLVFLAKHTAAAARSNALPISRRALVLAGRERIAVLLGIFNAATLLGSVIVRSI